MPKYVIEREIPGAGDLTQEQLQAMSDKAVRVVKDLGPGVQWLQSFIANDRIYCVYIAPDEDVLYKLGELTGFPTHRVSQIKSVIEPTRAK